MVAVASSRRWFWFAVVDQLSSDRGVWVDGEGVPWPLVLFGGSLQVSAPNRFQNSSTKSDSTGFSLGKGTETDTEFHPRRTSTVCYRTIFRSKRIHEFHICRGAVVNSRLLVEEPRMLTQESVLKSQRTLTQTFRNRGVNICKYK